MNNYHILGTIGHGGGHRHGGGGGRGWGGGWWGYPAGYVPPYYGYPVYPLATDEEGNINYVVMGASGVQKTLRKGDKGDDVMAAQIAITRNGFYAGIADGVFGSTTEQAVKDFQKSKGLSADGVIGPQTAAALGLVGGPLQIVNFDDETVTARKAIVEQMKQVQAEVKAAAEAKASAKTPTDRLIAQTQVENAAKKAKALAQAATQETKETTTALKQAAENAVVAKSPQETAQALTQINSVQIQSSFFGRVIGGLPVGTWIGFGAAALAAIVLFTGFVHTASTRHATP